MAAVLARWKLDVATVRERVYRAANPRERERWHALWLLARGWSAAEVAAALERDPHTIGAWLRAFEQDGPKTVAFEQTGGSPRADRRPARGAGGGRGRVAAGGRGRAGELDLEGGARLPARPVRGAPGKSGCLRDLHRLGCVCTRPKKRLTTADAAKRAAFVGAYPA